MEDELASAVERIINKYGTLSATGEAFGLTAQAIMKWKSKGRIPLERVPDVEKLTGIPRHELRPDFFGRLPAEAAG